LTAAIPQLGVCLMDDDHGRIAALLESVASAPDAELPRLFATAATEIAEHFAREEDLMRSAGLAILECHAPLHARLLVEVRQIGLSLTLADKAVARELLGTLLPQRLLHHIETADAATAWALREVQGAAAPFD
jgi:hemerythrin-like metal-binding protein